MKSSGSGRGHPPGGAAVFIFVSKYHRNDHNMTLFFSKTRSFHFYTNVERRRGVQAARDGVRKLWWWWWSTQINCKAIRRNTIWELVSDINQIARCSLLGDGVDGNDVGGKFWIFSAKKYIADIAAASRSCSLNKQSWPKKPLKG